MRNLEWTFASFVWSRAVYTDLTDLKLSQTYWNHGWYLWPKHIIDIFFLFQAQSLNGDYKNKCSLASSSVKFTARSNLHLALETRVEWGRVALDLRWHSTHTVPGTLQCTLHSTSIILNVMKNIQVLQLWNILMGKDQSWVRPVLDLLWHSAHVHILCTYFTSILRWHSTSTPYITHRT